MNVCVCVCEQESSFSANQWSKWTIMLRSSAREMEMKMNEQNQQIIGLENLLNEISTERIFPFRLTRSTHTMAFEWAQVFRVHVTARRPFYQYQ